MNHFLSKTLERKCGDPWYVGLNTYKHSYYQLKGIKQKGSDFFFFFGGKIWLDEFMELQNGFFFYLYKLRNRRFTGAQWANSFFVSINPKQCEFPSSPAAVILIIIYVLLHVFLHHEQPQKNQPVTKSSQQGERGRENIKSI